MCLFIMDVNILVLCTAGVGNVAVSCLTGTMKKKDSSSVRSTTGPDTESTATAAMKP